MELRKTMLALADHFSEQFRESFVSLLPEILADKPEQCSSELISSACKALSSSSQEASRCALQSLLQGFEMEEATIDREGIEHRLNRKSKKTFLTQFGKIELERALYYPAGGTSGTKQPAYCPLDEAWEMGGRFATPEVVEATLFASASLDPKEIKQLLEKLGAFSLSAEAIYDIRTNEGKAIHDWVQTDEGRGARLGALECPGSTGAFVAGLDGVNLALRETGTRRGRPPERPMSEGEEIQPKQSCYKNAMVGSFSHYGTKEVIDFHTGKPRVETDRLSSFYTAQMPQDRYPDFKREFEATLDAAEAQLPEGTVKMLLLDGGRPLWGYLEEKRDRFADYEKVLDYFHATEHLSQASEAIFGKKSEEGKAWYKHWCSKLKHEQWGVDGLIRSMGYYRAKLALTKSSIKLFEQQRGFFKRNRKWMNYASYTQRNLPIGSGPTEAACKTIVKERMCRSGMRWNREKGKSVLVLRTITKSGQWHETWNEYRRQCWDKAA